MEWLPANKKSREGMFLQPPPMRRNHSSVVEHFTPLYINLSRILMSRNPTDITRSKLRFILFHCFNHPTAGPNLASINRHRRTVDM